MYIITTLITGNENILLIIILIVKKLVIIPNTLQQYFPLAPACIKNNES